MIAVLGLLLGKMVEISTGETHVHHTITQWIVARGRREDLEKWQWTADPDRQFLFLRIVDLAQISVTTEVEDVGAEDAAHSEREVQEDQTLEGVVATMEEVFHHRFAIGMEENQTRYRRIIETKVLHPFPGETNTNASHYLAFHHIANLPRMSQHRQKAAHLLLPLQESKRRKQCRQIRRQRRNLPQNRNLHQDQKNHRHHPRASQPVLCLHWLGCWSWKHPWSTHIQNMFC